MNQTRQSYPQINAGVVESSSKTYKQSIDLRSGYNLISLRVDSTDFIVNAFSDSDKAKIEFVKNADGNIVDPSTTAWNSSAAFMIKLSSDYNQSAIEIEGELIPAGTQVSLAAGDNLVPYYGTGSIDALDALSSLITADNIVLVKDEKGNAIRLVNGSWLNTIGNFNEGEAYLINVKSAANISLQN